MKKQELIKQKITDLRSDSINHTLAVVAAMSLISLILEIFRERKIDDQLSLYFSTSSILLLLLVISGTLYIGKILCRNLKKNIQIVEDQKAEYQKLNAEYLKINHEELRRQIETAEESARFKQKFLANMSHEIRTPLTGVLGMVDILEKSDLAPLHREYVSILKQSGENLREIINQVLDFSKIEAGKITLKNENFRSDILFEKAEKIFKSICRKSIDFCIEKDPRVPEYIFADEGRIMQIINNLLTNSVKFTHTGSISIQSELISIEKELKTCTIKFSVTDTGIGIAPDKQKLLFTPFTQISDNGSSDCDGTGLGLSISKELAKLHGGEIGLVSKPCKGSTFWFTIQVEEGQPMQSEQIDNAPLAFAPKPLNILLAEDKKINQMVLKLLFTSMGYSLTIAENGKEVISLYEKGNFDLILMDIQMPVMDGITATRLLREQNSNLPPIIGLSANAFEGDREKYMNLGFDEYLTKPLEKENFYNALKSVFIMARVTG